MYNKCDLCNYSQGAFHQIEPIGNCQDDECELLIIGDYPKAEDDASGYPLSNSNLQFYWELLNDLKVKYKVVYAMKCIPIDYRNRRYMKPTISDFDTCIRNNLVNYIVKVAPECILTLGQLALEIMLGEGKKIGDYRERAATIRIPNKSVKLISTYSPSYAVDNESTMFMDRVIEDTVYASRHAMAYRYKDTYKTITLDAIEYSKLVDTLLLDDSVEYISFDTESNGLNPLVPGAKITSFSISYNYNVGYNIFCYHPELDISDEDRRIIIEASKKLLTSKKVIAHHIKHEYRYVKVLWGFTPNLVEDTMYMSYSLFMSKVGVSNGLKYLAGRFLQMPPWEEYINRYVDLFDMLKKLKTLDDDKIARYKDVYNDLQFTNEEVYKWYSILKDPDYYIRQVDSEDADIFMWMIPVRVLEKYAGMDAIAPLMLKDVLLPMIESDPALLESYRRVVKGGGVFANIELRGIRIEGIDRWTTIYEEKIAEHYEKLRSYDEVLALESEEGAVYNPNSSKQNSKLFFDYFKLPVIDSTSSGNPSTNENTLITLIKQYREKSDEKSARVLSFLENFRDYKKLSKIHSTYFIGLRRFMHENDAFDGHTNTYVPSPNGVHELHLHPQYLLHGTETGRLSSSNPSMHVIPFRSDVKSILVPHDHKRGGLFVSADQSQLEIRVLACIVEKFYGDPSLANAYREGRDIHRYNASKIFSKPEEEVVDAERRFAKTISFSLLYGSTEYTVSENTGRTVEECAQLFNQFFEAFPGVKLYIEDMHKYASTYGCVRTPFGRIRHLENALHPEVRSKYEASKRQAQNTVIQSTGSDMSLVSINYMDDHLIEKNYKSAVIAFVHDSITIDTHPGELFEMIDLLKYSMKTLLEMLPWVTCPLGVDIDITDNMADHCGLKSMEILEDGSRILVLDGYDYEVAAVINEMRVAYEIISEELLSEKEFFESPGDLVARKAINLGFDNKTFIEQKKKIHLRKK